MATKEGEDILERAFRANAQFLAVYNALKDKPHLGEIPTLEETYYKALKKTTGIDTTGFRYKSIFKPSRKNEQARKLPDNTVYHLEVDNNDKQQFFFDNGFFLGASMQKDPSDPDYTLKSYKLICADPDGERYSPTVNLRTAKTSDGSDGQILDLGIVWDQRMVSAFYAEGKLISIAFQVDDMSTFAEEVRGKSDFDYDPIFDLANPMQVYSHMKNPLKTYAFLAAYNDGWRGCSFQVEHPYFEQPIPQEDIALLDPVPPFDSLQEDSLNIRLKTGSNFLQIQSEQFEGTKDKGGIRATVPLMLPQATLSFKDLLPEILDWTPVFTYAQPVALEVPLLNIGYQSRFVLST